MEQSCIPLKNIDVATELQERFATICADARPTMVIIAEGDDRKALEQLSARSGIRLLRSLSIEDGREGLRDIVNVDLVVLACETPVPALLPLLARLDMLAAAGDIALVAMIGLDCVDLAYAHLQAPDIQLLCQPSAGELVAALAFGLMSRSQQPSFFDVRREDGQDQLEQLSEEVRRLARMLDGMAREGWMGLVQPVHGRRSSFGDGLNDAPFGDRSLGLATEGGILVQDEAPLRAGRVRDILRARRLRDQFMPADLFADPAWDMMLDLMAARLSGERVSVSSLCIAAAVPPTTALRWIRQLTERGVFVRQADPADGRRVFITLSDESAAAVSRWFVASRRLLCESA